MSMRSFRNGTESFGNSNSSGKSSITHQPQHVHILKILQIQYVKEEVIQLHDLAVELHVLWLNGQQIKNVLRNNKKNLINL